LTPSARSANLIAGDGMKNGFPAPNKELAKTKNNHLTGKARCEPDFHFLTVEGSSRSRRKGVAVVQKAAELEMKAARVGARPARHPPDRTDPGDALDRRDAEADMLALDRFRDHA
jgi:hypothetical protein